MLVPIGLAAVLLLQIALRMPAYAESTLLAILYLFWSAALIWLGNALRRAVGWPAFCSAIAWFALTGGLISAVIGIIQQYQVHSFLDPYLVAPVDGGVHGNLGQANHFANYTAIAIASLTYLRLRRKIPAPAFVPLAGVLLLALALSASRSTWLYLGTFTGIALWFRLRAPNSTHRALLVVACGLLASYMAIHLLLWPGFLTSHAAADTVATPAITVASPVNTAAPPPPSRMNSPGTRLFQIASAVSVRWYLWQQAWHMFLQAPALGVGFGEYGWHLFLQSTQGPHPEPFPLDKHSHNAVLQLLAETGLLGGGIVIGGLMLWAWGTRGLTASPEKWWLLAALAVIGIHSMLEYPLWYAYFLGIAAILLGAAEARCFEITLGTSARVSYIALLVLGCAGLIGTLRSYASLEGWLYTNKFIQTADDRGRRQRAEALVELHRRSLLRPFIEMAYAGTLAPDRNRMAEKLALNARVMRYAPVNTIVFRHFLLLAVSGDIAGAKLHLDRAAEVYPEDLASFADFVAKLAAQDPVTFGPAARLVQIRLAL